MHWNYNFNCRIYYLITDTSNRGLGIKLKGFKFCTVYPSQVVLVVKNLPANEGRHHGHRFNPCVGKISWRRKWQLTPVFLSGEFPGQWILAGYIQSMGSQRVGQGWSDLAHPKFKVTDLLFLIIQCHNWKFCWDLYSSYISFMFWGKLLSFHNV